MADSDYASQALAVGGTPVAVNKTTGAILVDANPATTIAAARSVTVQSNAATLLAAADANRRSLLVVNMASVWVYVSAGAAATVADGIPLAPATASQPGGYRHYKGSEAVGAFSAIAASATADVRVE